MQHLKRLAWLFSAGFITVAGACAAAYVATSLFENRSEAQSSEKYRIDPRNYQPPKTGGVIFTEVKLAKLTNRGGVFGFIENRTKRDIRSFNADLSLSRNGEVLHRCSETVSVSVSPDEKATFQLLCSDLDRNALTDDMQPALSINWVYPSLDE